MILSDHLLISHLVLYEPISGMIPFLVWTDFEMAPWKCSFRGNVKCATKSPLAENMEYVATLGHLREVTRKEKDTSHYFLAASTIQSITYWLNRWCVCLILEHQHSLSGRCMCSTHRYSAEIITAVLNQDPSSDRCSKGWVGLWTLWSTSHIFSSWLVQLNILFLQRSYLCRPSNGSIRSSCKSTLPNVSLCF